MMLTLILDRNGLLIYQFIRIYHNLSTIGLQIVLRQLLRAAMLFAANCHVISRVPSAHLT